MTLLLTDIGGGGPSAYWSENCCLVSRGHPARDTGQEALDGKCNGGEGQ